MSLHMKYIIFFLSHSKAYYWDRLSNLISVWLCYVHMHNMWGIHTITDSGKSLTYRQQTTPASRTLLQEYSDMSMSGTPMFILTLSEIDSKVLSQVFFVSNNHQLWFQLFIYGTGNEVGIDVYQESSLHSLQWCEETGKTLIMMTERVPVRNLFYGPILFMRTILYIRLTIMRVTLNCKDYRIEAVFSWSAMIHSMYYFIKDIHSGWRKRPSGLVYWRL